MLANHPLERDQQLRNGRAPRHALSEQGFRVLGYDLPGRGYSDRPELD